MMSRQIRRPQSVTWLTVFVLIITGWQWFRLISILQEWKPLNELSLSISPIFLALSSLIWGGLASALAWGLVLGKRWAPSALRGLSLAFALTLWIDRIFWQAGELNNNNQGFILLVTLLALVTVFWIVSRSEARAFFGEHNE